LSIIDQGKHAYLPALGRRLEHGVKYEYYTFSHKEDVMRKLAFYGALAVVLGCSLSAGAADNTASDFYAVSQLDISTELNVMSDSDLTKVEGMSYDSRHDCGCHGKYGPSSSSSVSIDQSNSLLQANFNHGGKRGGDVSQGNFALQINNAMVR
jgi:hypothetical protein